MSSTLKKYQKTVDQLPGIVKLMILIVILGAISTIWYYNFWQDLQTSIRITSQKIKVLKTSVTKSEKQVKIIESNFEFLKNFSKNNKAKNKILTPHQTKTVLHNLLMANKHLKLLKLKNIPPIAAILPNANSKIKIFEHGLMIKFTGDYPSTMHYLGAVEKLPWKIFWDKIEYKVIDYPIAEITLYLHTTSDDDDWLHV